MNFRQLLHTIVYLKPTQIFFQMKNKVVKPGYISMSAPVHKMPTLKTKPVARHKGVEGDVFTLINLHYKFEDWNYSNNGTLFTYNLNYFDFINADDITPEDACRWIDRFIIDRPHITQGMDPYPIALRCINWTKFFCRHPECATKEREDSLYSQYRLLGRKLEYHLLGNHLLEDALSLTIGGHYFGDERLKQKGMTLLLHELQEQILPDGAHYEQSPMYHCILLDRLLDTYNITGFTKLVPFAKRMLGHLESICYEDGTWPFFGDTALGIAPIPRDIKDYAHRLGIIWEALPLKECGYRKMQSKKMEAFVDVGNIMASYQPGHSHADTLSYELHIDGKPVIIDTGTSTYDKTARRQLERSTIAHNCVVADGRSSSEVWGGFRIGKRCKVTILRDEENYIEGSHDGFSMPCQRSFRIDDKTFAIEDHYQGNAVSILHIATDFDIGRIHVEGANSIEITEGKYSVTYNQFLPCKIMTIRFNNKIRYTIQ